MAESRIRLEKIVHKDHRGDFPGANCSYIRTYKRVAIFRAGIYFLVALNNLLPLSAIYPSGAGSAQAKSEEFSHRDIETPDFTPNSTKRKNPLLAQSSTSAKSEARARAIAQYNEKQYSAAASTLEAYLSGSPTDITALYYAALANQQIGKTSQAMTYYKRVAELAPESKLGAYSKSILQKLSGSAPSNSGSSTSSMSNAAYSSPSRNMPDSSRIYYRAKGDAIMITVFINGKPLEMLFDTGAPDLCLSVAHLQQLGVPVPNRAPDGQTGGAANNTVMPIWMEKANVKVGQIERDNVSMTVFAQLHSEPLLGQTFFKDFDYTIDHQARCLELVRKGSRKASSATGYSVPFQFLAQGNRVIVDVTINGRAGPMILDTGNTAAGVVFHSRAQAAQYGAPVPEDASVGMASGVSGSGATLNYVVNRMKLGPIEQFNMSCSVNTQGAGGFQYPLLGQPALQGWQVTVDMENKKLHMLRR